MHEKRFLDVLDTMYAETKRPVVESIANGYIVCEGLETDAKSAQLALEFIEAYDKHIETLKNEGRLHELYQPATIEVGPFRMYLIWDYEKRGAKYFGENGSEYDGMFDPTTNTIIINVAAVLPKSLYKLCSEYVPSKLQAPVDKTFMKYLDALHSYVYDIISHEVRHLYDKNTNLYTGSQKKLGEGMKAYSNDGSEQNAYVSQLLPLIIHLHKRRANRSGSLFSIIKTILLKLNGRDKDTLLNDVINIFDNQATTKQLTPKNRMKALKRLYNLCQLVSEEPTDKSEREIYESVIKKVLGDQQRVPYENAGECLQCICDVLADQCNKVAAMTRNPALRDAFLADAQTFNECRTYGDPTKYRMIVEENIVAAVKKLRTDEMFNVAVAILLSSRNLDTKPYQHIIQPIADIVKKYGLTVPLKKYMV